MLASLRGLRLAHLIESDGPGGAERMVASLVAELQAAGATNVVVLPADGEGWLARELRGTGALIEPFRLDRPLSASFARWLTQTFRRHQVALAHSHEFTMAVYGAWAARRAHVPHLFTMHGGRYYAERLRRRIAMRLATELSGAIVAVSTSLQRHLSRDLWMRSSRITTIPNGARATSGARDVLRAELNLASTDHLAVAVGNLYAVKGHLHLVEALGLLAARCPNLHVALAGRGELEERLRTRAGELGVSHRLHVLGLRSDVGNVLAAADVFVLPSLSEGVPLALLEAMLAERPIVATTAGDVPAVLDTGRAGLLVPPGDAAALAHALYALFADPGQARRLGAAGGQRARTEYSLQRMIDRYVQLYAELLAPRLPSTRPDPLLESSQVPVGKPAVGRQRT